MNNNRSFDNSRDETVQSQKERLYKIASPEIQKWLDEAEFISVVDPQTKEEKIQVEITNPKLEEWLQEMEKYIYIADGIEQLLSERLRNMAFTEDLQKEWERARATNFLLSEHFLFNIPNVNRREKENYEKNLNSKLTIPERNSLSRCLLNEKAQFLHKKWELLDAVHPYMKRQFALKGNPYPFETSCDLFLDILKTEEDERFINKLNKVHYVDVPKWGKFWGFINENFKSKNFSKNKAKELLELRKQLSPNQQGIERKYESYIERNFNPYKHPEQWFAIAMAYCTLLSEKHTKISKLLKAFEEQVVIYANAQKENAEAKNNKGKLFKSVTWCDGVRTVAGRGGIRIPKR